MDDSVTNLGTLLGFKSAQSRPRTAVENYMISVYILRRFLGYFRLPKSGQKSMQFLYFRRRAPLGGPLGSKLWFWIVFWLILGALFVIFWLIFMLAGPPWQAFQMLSRIDFHVGGSALAGPFPTCFVDVCAGGPALAGPFLNQFEVILAI